MSKADGLSVKQWQDDVIKGVCVCYMGLLKHLPVLTHLYIGSLMCVCVFMLLIYIITQ